MRIGYLLLYTCGSAPVGTFSFLALNLLKQVIAESRSILVASLPNIVLVTGKILVAQTTIASYSCCGMLYLLFMT